MTKTQKIIGTSLFSLLLVCVGMFMVCSGRSARVGNEEDYASQEDLDEQYRNDLLSKLEFLENQSGLQQESPDSETTILVADANDEPPPPAPSVDNSAESFLTPTLFSNMQSEIDQLQAIANSKERELQAARGELRDVDARLAMGETRMSARAAPKSSSRSRLTPAAGDPALDGEYGASYQEALDDYYTRRYDSAIRKFAELLSRNDQHMLADNCQYWIGESYFAKGDYYQAAAEFHKVYTFMDTNKQDDAQLMIGLSFMKAGERELAVEELSALMNFSKSKETQRKAERYLRQLERV
jgi:TolA-binding protein